MFLCVEVGFGFVFKAEVGIKELGSLFENATPMGVFSSLGRFFKERPQWGIFKLGSLFQRATPAGESVAVRVALSRLI